MVLGRFLACFPFSLSSAYCLLLSCCLLVIEMKGLASFRKLGLGASFLFFSLVFYVDENLKAASFSLLLLKTRPTSSAAAAAALRSLC